ncbi:hypothetical protein MRS60_34825 [Burkholderia pyrrocinia]|uniref:hypothetical protein n=1 Tax=Burkholderia pyrrocinia TaxID=60550 RepID=UPI00126A52C9|nr:hypothetical protein [Burkholderia pyrrocinia]UOB60282.1 hypothetical protein MRS60_34825 [Burkholderia pyrrocinia]
MDILQAAHGGALFAVKRVRAAHHADGHFPSDAGHAPPSVSRCIDNTHPGRHWPVDELIKKFAFLYEIECAFIEPTVQFTPGIQTADELPVTWAHAPAPMHGRRKDASTRFGMAMEMPRPNHPEWIGEWTRFID